jgi:hypothetical protein
MIRDEIIGYKISTTPMITDSTVIQDSLTNYGDGERVVFTIEDVEMPDGTVLETSVNAVLQNGELVVPPGSFSVVVT